MSLSGGKSPRLGEPSDIHATRSLFCIRYCLSVRLPGRFSPKGIDKNLQEK